MDSRGLAPLRALRVLAVLYLPLASLAAELMLPIPDRYCGLTREAVCAVDLLWAEYTDDLTVSRDAEKLLDVGGVCVDVRVLSVDGPPVVPVTVVDDAKCGLPGEKLDTADRGEKWEVTLGTYAMGMNSDELLLEYSAGSISEYWSEVVEGVGLPSGRIDDDGDGCTALAMLLT